MVLRTAGRISVKWRAITSRIATGAFQASLIVLISSLPVKRGSFTTPVCQPEGVLKISGMRIGVNTGPCTKYPEQAKVSIENQSIRRTATWITGIGHQSMNRHRKHAASASCAPRKYVPMQTVPNFTTTTSAKGNHMHNHNAYTMYNQITKLHIIDVSSDSAVCLPWRQ